MTNPAQALADLLQQWTPDDSKTAQPVFAARGGRHPGDVAFWQTQITALGYISEIERRITDLERAGFAQVAPSRSLLPVLCRAVILPDSQWSSATGGALLSDIEIGALRTLGALLDIAASTRVSITPSKVRAFQESVEEAQNLLAEFGSELSDAERIYLSTLLESAQTLLQEKNVNGSVDLGSLADQLVGALIGAGVSLGQSDNSEGAKRFAATAMRFATALRAPLYDLAAVSAVTSSLWGPLLAIGTGGSGAE